MPADLVRQMRSQRQFDCCSTGVGDRKKIRVLPAIAKPSAAEMSRKNQRGMAMG
jgi:hypothetical protein